MDFNRRKCSISLQYCVAQQFDETVVIYIKRTKNAYLISFLRAIFNFRLTLINCFPSCFLHYSLKIYFIMTIFYNDKNARQPKYTISFVVVAVVQSQKGTHNLYTILIASNALYRMSTHTSH